MLKKVVLRKNPTLHDQSAPLRIQRVFKERGYFPSFATAWLLWASYSYSHNVAWHGLPDQDDELFEILRPYWEPEKGCCYECNEPFETCVDESKTHTDETLNANHKPYTLWD
jgi:hypothetical protein